MKLIQKIPSLQRLQQQCNQDLRQRRDHTRDHFGAIKRWAPTVDWRRGPFFPASYQVPAPTPTHVVPEPERTRPKIG